MGALTGPAIRRKRLRLLLVATIGVGGALLGCSTSADPGDPTASVSLGDGAEPTSQSVPPSFEAGRVPLRERLSRSDVGLEVKRLPNGARLVDLQDRYHHASVIRVRDDGTVERGCVDTPQALDGWLNGGDARPQRGGSTP